MSSRAKTIVELPTSDTISADDLFVVEKVVGANTTTSSISGSALKSAIIAGPYDDDTAAGEAGVEIGHLYYTSDGAAKVRLV